MNRAIYIMGTSHRYQHLSKDLSEESHCGFQELIKSVISANDISIIAEESSLEALNENGISKSALQLVAEEVDTGHLLTEAERSYRSANGMEQENDIKASGFIKDLNKSEIDKRIQESYRARERYWLTQILNEDIWPVLFICGANHAIHFHNLATNEGLDAILLYEDWSNIQDYQTGFTPN